MGTRLLEHVKDWFKRYDIHSIQLQVYRHNKNGRGFWRGKGFEPFVDRIWLDL